MSADKLDPAALSTHAHVKAEVVKRRKARKPRRIAFSGKGTILPKPPLGYHAAAVQEFLDTMARIKRVMAMQCEGTALPLRPDGMCEYCGKSPDPIGGMARPHTWDGNNT